MLKIFDFVRNKNIIFSPRIDSQLNVKIADNALSRDLFPNDYHCLGDNENRPIKWLAIESLVYKTFSAASDVVSDFQNGLIFFASCNCPGNDFEILKVVSKLSSVL